jgi:hypothetical protein
MGWTVGTLSGCQFPDALIKRKIIFLIYKEMGSVAKSYMRKGFLIDKNMQKYLTIYKEAVSHI